MNSNSSNLRLYLVGLSSLILCQCAPKSTNLKENFTKSTVQNLQSPSDPWQVWLPKNSEDPNPTEFVHASDSSQHLIFRGFARDLDPRIQADTILEREKTLRLQILGKGAQIQRSGDSLWMRQGGLHSISWVQRIGDSLLIVSQWNSSGQAQIAAEDLYALVPEHRPISTFASNTPSLQLQIPPYFANWQVKPGSLSLEHALNATGPGQEQIRSLNFQMQSDAMTKDELVQNTLLAFEIEPANLSGHWSKLDDSTSRYSFSSDSIIGQAWLQNRKYALAWASKNNANTKVIEDSALGASLLESARPQASDEAALLNLQGLQLTLRGENLPALSLFEKAFDLDTTEAVYLVNCAYVYQNEGLYGPGIHHLREHPELIRSSSRLSRALGGLLEMSLSFQEALDQYRNAERYLYEDQENRIDISDALWGLGYQGPSLNLVEDLYDKAPTQRLGIYMGKTMIGMDQYEAATKTLREVKKKWGPTPDLRHHLSLALMLQEQYDEALAEAATLVKENPDTAEYWFMKGQIEYQLRRFKQANASLDQALKIQKDYTDAFTLKSIVSGFLGQGDYAPIAKVITPVEPLPKIQELLFQNWGESQIEDHLRIHTRRTSIQYQKSGWKKTELMLVQVQSPEGVSSMQELNWSFLPGYDKFYPNAILVLDQNLQIKSSIPLKSMYVTGEKSGNDSSETRVVHVPLRGIKPGDYVLTQVSFQSLAKNAPFPFIHHKVSLSQALGKDELKVWADSGSFRHENYGDSKMEHPSTGLWTWTMLNPPRLIKESYMPQYTDFGSGVLLAGSLTWASAGDEYFKLIRRQLQSTLSVQEKAFEIKGSESSTYKTIHKFNDWVKNTLEYEHIAFGGHSLIPTKPAETLRRKRGDCKDKSVLLQALLSANNIPSELALTSLDDQVFEGMVSTEQFDHMLVHIPAGTDYPEMWVDPSEGPSTNRPVPYELENKVALILREGGKSEISLIPVLEIQSNHGGEFHHLVNILPSSKYQFRDSIVLRGKFADYFRTAGRGILADRARPFVQNILAEEINGVQVQEARFAFADDYDKDFVITAIYEAPFGGIQNDQNWQGRIPTFWEKLFLRLAEDKSRNFPLRLPQEHQFLSTFELKNSTGNLELPKLPNSVYTQSQCQSNGSRKISCQWSTLASLVNPEDFGSIYTEWSDLKDALQIRWNIPSK